MKKFLTEDKLNALFNTFITDKSEHITRKHIKEKFNKQGVSFTGIDLNEIMKQHAKPGNNYIDKEDFSNMLLQNTTEIRIKTNSYETHDS